MSNEPDTESGVDPAEVDKFNALAHRWWDPEGEFRPLHAINPLRVNYIKARATLPGAHVLDAGCGGGILAEALAAEGARVTGIDVAATALGVARLHAAESGADVEYKHVSPQEHAMQTVGEYDVVACLEVLEHVPDVASTMRSLATLTRPGGDIFLATINRNPVAYTLAVVGAEYVMRLLPKGTHDYDRFIKPSELAAHCRTAGLHVEHVCGMRYNPFNHTASLATQPTVNYLMHARKPD